MRTRNMMTPILAAALGLTIAFAAPAAYGWSQTALAAEEAADHSQYVRRKWHLCRGIYVDIDQ